MSYEQFQLPGKEFSTPFTETLGAAITANPVPESNINTPATVLTRHLLAHEVEPGFDDTICEQNTRVRNIRPDQDTRSIFVD